MAFQYYLSFKGKTQGQVKGSSTKSSHPDKWVEVTSFKMGVPRDSASGLPSAKKNKPLVITKESDSASPLLLQAHWAGEVLTEVILETRVKGHVFKRITLTGAVLAGTGRSLRPLSPEHVPSQGQKTPFLEEYSFTFDKILVENVAGSTSTSDDWTANNS